VAVDRVVEDDLLVDLVAEHHEPVAAGDVDQLADHLLGVDRAGGVVRIDDHQPAGAVGDLRLDVRQIGLPVLLLVAAVVHGPAAGQGDRPGPQRVVGRGHQDLVAVVDERLEDHGDQLGDAVADEDVVDADLGQPVRLVVLRDGGAGGVDATRVGVALGVRKVVHDVGDDRFGCLEAEGGQVADVQLEYAVALGLQTLCLGEDRAPHVVTDVPQFAALDDLAHSATLSGTTLCQHALLDPGAPPGGLSGMPVSRGRGTARRNRRSGRMPAAGCRHPAAGPASIGSSAPRVIGRRGIRRAGPPDAGDAGTPRRRAVRSCGRRRAAGSRRPGRRRAPRPGRRGARSPDGA